MQTREELLQQFAGIVDRNARSGVLGVPVRAIHLRGIAGPRAGALELWAAEHTGALLRVLTRDDAALLRQMIPWDFGRNRPNAFMSGRYLRLDAPWPDALATMLVPLAGVGAWYARGTLARAEKTGLDTGMTHTLEVVRAVRVANPVPTTAPSAPMLLPPPDFELVHSEQRVIDL